MNLLNSYINGNTHVSIYDDGTKVREFNDKPVPVHPESMDVKITNYCNGGCRWCHEKSDISGQHANLTRLLEVIKDLPSGVEIAIGGGDTLSHPDLFPFLRELKKRGLIANITVNQKHFKSYRKEIQTLLEDKLIYGIGVSYNGTKYQTDIAPFISMTSNIVFHLIMGINSIDEINDLIKFVNVNGGEHCKVLILGYKTYGKGSVHYVHNKEAIEHNKLIWFRYIPSFFKKKNLTLSFDNLAISQLNLKRFFTDDAWNKFYMGSEGKFSMYIDAVNQEYAICSTDPNRVSFNDIDLFTYFRNIPE
jgi:hypothetical protein